MPASTAKQKKYDLRRGEVIDAAAAVFAKLGYHGASMKLIADRVGMHQSGLYYYFDSKEAALEEVCLEGIGNLIESFLGINATDEPADTKLRAAVHDHVSRAEKLTDYVRVFINQRQFLPDASRKSIGRKVRQYERMMADLIRCGVEQQLFKRDLDCELATLGLLGECNAVYIWYGKRAKSASASKIAADIVDRFLDGVRARNS